MNLKLTTLPSTDPAQILRYRDRQYAAELLAVALLHLDMFTWLKDNPGANTRDVCLFFDLKDRPADVLLTLLRANGFITTDAVDRHTITQLAEEHLVKSSPWFLGPYYAPIRDTPIVRNFLKVLRTGKPAGWQAKDNANDWHTSMLDETFAQSFTDLMNCRGLAFGQKLAERLAPLLGKRNHLLDVGGGSGIYASTLVAAYPQLKATVLEQKPVDAIVMKEVAKHGLGDRISLATADMFKDPWPEGIDILLLSNLLHDWDLPEVRALLKKSAETLPKGGLLVIHGAFINDDKTGPLPVAEYSALLMNITQGKCYSAAEFRPILEELGFAVRAYQDTIADRGFLSAVKQ